MLKRIFYGTVLSTIMVAGGVGCGVSTDDHNKLKKEVKALHQASSSVDAAHGEAINGLSNKHREPVQTSISIALAPMTDADTEKHATPLSAYVLINDATQANQCSLNPKLTKMDDAKFTDDNETTVEAEVAGNYLVGLSSDLFRGDTNADDRYVDLGGSEKMLIAMCLEGEDCYVTPDQASDLVALMQDYAQKSTRNKLSKEEVYRNYKAYLGHLRAAAKADNLEDKIALGNATSAEMAGAMCTALKNDYKSDRAFFAEVAKTPRSVSCMDDVKNLESLVATFAEVTATDMEVIQKDSKGVARSGVHMGYDSTNNQWKVPLDRYSAHITVPVAAPSNVSDYRKDANDAMMAVTSVFADYKQQSVIASACLEGHCGENTRTGSYVFADELTMEDGATADTCETSSVAGKKLHEITLLDSVGTSSLAKKENYLVFNVAPSAGKSVDGSVVFVKDGGEWIPQTCASVGAPDNSDWDGDGTNDSSICTEVATHVIKTHESHKGSNHLVAYVGKPGCIEEEFIPNGSAGVSPKLRCNALAKYDATKVDWMNSSDARIVILQSPSRDVNGYRGVKFTAATGASDTHHINVTLDVADSKLHETNGDCATEITDGGKTNIASRFTMTTHDVGGDMLEMVAQGAGSAHNMSDSSLGDKARCDENLSLAAAANILLAARPGANLLSNPLGKIMSDLFTAPMNVAFSSYANTLMPEADYQVSLTCSGEKVDTNMTVRSDKAGRIAFNYPQDIVEEHCAAGVDSITLKNTDTTTTCNHEVTIKTNDYEENKNACGNTVQPVEEDTDKDAQGSSEA